MTKNLVRRSAQLAAGGSIVAAVTLLIGGIAGATVPTASAATASLVATETASAFPVILAVAGGIVGLVVFLWAIGFALGIFHPKKPKV